MSNYTNAARNAPESTTGEASIAWAILALVDELRENRAPKVTESATFGGWAPGDVVTITGDDGKRTVLVRTERLDRWACSEDPVHCHDDIQVDQDVLDGRVTVLARRGLAV